jgi:hypothetical protein
MLVMLASKKYHFQDISFEVVDRNGAITIEIIRKKNFVT